MKNYLLIGLFALALVLGTGCKKEGSAIKGNAKSEVTKDFNKPIENTNVQSTEPGGGTMPPIPAGGSIFDYNPNVYPHVTGGCYCGQGPNCHPQTGGRWERHCGDCEQYIYWPPY